MEREVTRRTRVSVLVDVDVFDDELNARRRIVRELMLRSGGSRRGDHYCHRQLGHGERKQGRPEASKPVALQG
jgi:hypothetical protein